MSKDSKKPTLKANEKKWGKENIDAGWTLVPNALLIHQAALGLTPMDINIILQIARYWWQPDNHPYPSKRALADCIGVTPRTIQGRITALHKLGFIERQERRGTEKGSKTNIYRLTALAETLTPFSQEIVARRTERKQEDSEIPNRRGKPSLKVVGE